VISSQHRFIDQAIDQWRDRLMQVSDKSKHSEL